MKKQRMILRLDDASERMDVEKWQRMEDLLEKYNIMPLVGVIPACKDPAMEKYDADPLFWDKVHRWIKKGWTIAMHGYMHLYETTDGGINPVNKKSEFAGLPYEKQADKIKCAWQIMQKHDITPKLFFAPSHTFDDLTLDAIKAETPIRIISDTPACDIYKRRDFVFIPQQSGSVRNLPFKTITFCYHPNTMTDRSFSDLEGYLIENKQKFCSVDELVCDRKRSVLDMLINKTYFAYLNLRRLCSH